MIERLPERGQIAVLGDVGIDFYFDLGQSLAPDEKAYAVRSRRDLGGTAANSAAAILALGGMPILAGLVGSDALGDVVRGMVRDHDLSSRHLRVAPGSTMVAVVVLRGDDREVVVDRGVVDDGAWSALETITSGADLIYLSGTPLSVAEEVLRSAGKRPVVVGIEARQLSTANVSEWLAVWRDSQLLLTNLAGQRALAALGVWAAASEMWPGPVAVTMGREGAVLMSYNNTGVRFRALPVEPVDTTGAGDCFAGTVCYFMSQGEPVLNSVRLGIAAAGLSTLKLGSQGRLPSREEVLDAVHDIGDGEEVGRL